MLKVINFDHSIVKVKNWWEGYFQSWCFRQLLGPRINASLQEMKLRYDAGLFPGKKAIFSDVRTAFEFFSYLFCCLLTQPLSRLAFQYEFLFNHLFPLFFRNIHLCDWILHLNENFTNFIHLTFSFILSGRNITVKVLEIRYYYKMPDLFRTCLC